MLRRPRYSAGSTRRHHQTRAAAKGTIGTSFGIGKAHHALHFIGRNRLHSAERRG
jgi:hypothetical protein